MGVNSGSLGTEISFSQLQTSYGGSHPISLSEYYRGGANVPSTMTVVNKAAASASGGVGTNDTAQIDVDVTTTTSAGSFTSDNNYSIYGGFFGAISVTSNISVILLGTVHPDKDGGSSNIGYTVSAGGTTYSINSNDNSGNGAFIVDRYIRGPAYQNGDQNLIPGGSVSLLTTLSAGQSINIITPSNPGSMFRYRRGFRNSVTAYNHRIQNDSSVTVNLTSSPWGNDSSFTPGEVKNDNGNSSPSWSWSHPVVTTTTQANTNIPTQGNPNNQLSIDIFNVPGSFSA